MLYFTFMIPVVLIVLLFSIVDSWMMKRPWTLLLFGFLSAGLGLAIKSIPLTLRANQLSPSEVIFLEFAASALDPTLLALAGGLIASAFILKIQHNYDDESTVINETFAEAVKCTKSADTFANDLEKDRLNLSVEEYERRRKDLEFMRVRAHFLMQRAEAEHHRLEGRWRRRQR